MMTSSFWLRGLSRGPEVKNLPSNAMDMWVRPWSGELGIPHAAGQSAHTPHRGNYMLQLLSWHLEPAPQLRKPGLPTKTQHRQNKEMNVEAFGLKPEEWILPFPLS